MRKIAITGAASGIGKALAALLTARGDMVIGIDRNGTEIVADLSAQAGRDAMAAAVRARAGGGIDAVVACAGVSAAEPSVTVAVNFFGAVAAAELLHPLLRGSGAARVLLVSSEAVLLPSDPDTVAACLANDEAAAQQAARLAPDMSYASSKLALSRWVKREAITAKWAGAGIPLNAVAPGVVATPMAQPLLDTAEGLAMLEKVAPTALGRVAEAHELAAFIAFLVSPENSFIIGQTLFCDGGAEAILRPENV